jgi:preprotein translocase subunit SecG
MLNTLIMILLFVTACFLVLLVLIQRGRGGGLAGAFGGLGGQSAFGTKAGDLFTRITIGVAAFWIILCAASVKLLNDQDGSQLDIGSGAAATAPATEGAGTSENAAGNATEGASDAAPGAAGAGTKSSTGAPAAGGESPAPAADQKAAPSK